MRSAVFCRQANAMCRPHYTDLKLVVTSKVLLYGVTVNVSFV